MVVRCRPELWAPTSDDIPAIATATRARRTSSFYFAHRGAGGDDGKREEQQRGRNLARYSVRVQKRHHVADRLQRRDCARANENREEDAGKRASGNQAGTEQCAGTQL